MGAARDAMDGGRRDVLKGIGATAAAAVLGRTAAADETPRAAGREFATWKFGMFLHFNMGTFADREWATGYEDPELFAPTKLSCSQWADAAAAAGMKYAVLTTKHTGAWCLWPSAYTKHGVQSFARYRNGKGDIVREYVDAFRGRGIKVGFYYCFPGDYAGSKELGNPIPAGKPDLHGLPPEAIGDYSGFMKKQLKELFAYKPDLFWIDQWKNPYTEKDWPGFMEMFRRDAPECVVISNNARDLTGSDVLSYEFPWKGDVPAEGNTKPAEVSDCLQTKSRWFWHPNLGDADWQSVAAMAERYRMCQARHANYCLDVPPNREGLIPEVYVKRIKELGKAVGTKG